MERQRIINDDADGGIFHLFCSWFYRDFENKWEKESKEVFFPFLFCVSGEPHLPSFAFAPQRTKKEEKKDLKQK